MQGFPLNNTAGGRRAAKKILAALGMLAVVSFAASVAAAKSADLPSCEGSLLDGVPYCDVNTTIDPSLVAVSRHHFTYTGTASAATTRGFGQCIFDPKYGGVFFTSPISNAIGAVFSMETKAAESPNVVMEFHAYIGSGVAGYAPAISSDKMVAELRQPSGIAIFNLAAWGIESSNFIAVADKGNHEIRVFDHGPGIPGRADGVLAGSHARSATALAGTPHDGFGPTSALLRNPTQLAAALHLGAAWPPRLYWPDSGAHCIRRGIFAAVPNGTMSNSVDITWNGGFTLRTVGNWYNGGWTDGVSDGGTDIRFEVPFSIALTRDEDNLFVGELPVSAAPARLRRIHNLLGADVDFLGIVVTTVVEFGDRHTPHALHLHARFATYDPSMVLFIADGTGNTVLRYSPFMDSTCAKRWTRFQVVANASTLGIPVGVPGLFISSAFSLTNGTVGVMLTQPGANTVAPLILMAANLSASAFGVTPCYNLANDVAPFFAPPRPQGVTLRSASAPANSIKSVTALLPLNPDVTGYGSASTPALAVATAQPTVLQSVAFTAPWDPAMLSVSLGAGGGLQQPNDEGAVDGPYAAARFRDVHTIVAFNPRWFHRYATSYRHGLATEAVHFLVSDTGNGCLRMIGGGTVKSLMRCGATETGTLMSTRGNDTYQPAGQPAGSGRPVLGAPSLIVPFVGAAAPGRVHVYSLSSLYVTCVRRTVVEDTVLHSDGAGEGDNADLMTHVHATTQTKVTGQTCATSGTGTNVLGTPTPSFNKLTAMVVMADGQYMYVVDSGILNNPFGPNVGTIFRVTRLAQERAVFNDAPSTAARDFSTHVWGLHFTFRSHDAPFAFLHPRRNVVSDLHLFIADANASLVHVIRTRLSIRDRGVDGTTTIAQIPVIDTEQTYTRLSSRPQLAMPLPDGETLIVGLRGALASDVHLSITHTNMTLLGAVDPYDIRRLGNQSDDGWVPEIRGGQPIIVGSSNDVSAMAAAGPLGSIFFGTAQKELHVMSTTTLAGLSVPNVATLPKLSSPIKIFDDFIGSVLHVNLGMFGAQNSWTPRNGNSQAILLASLQDMRCIGFISATAGLPEPIAAGSPADFVAHLSGQCDGNTGPVTLTDGIGDAATHEFAIHLSATAPGPRYAPADHVLGAEYTPDAPVILFAELNRGCLRRLDIVEHDSKLEGFVHTTVGRCTVAAFADPTTYTDGPAYDVSGAISHVLSLAITADGKTAWLVDGSVEHSRLRRIDQPLVRASASISTIYYEGATGFATNKFHQIDGVFVSPTADHDFAARLFVSDSVMRRTAAFVDMPALNMRHTIRGVQKDDVVNFAAGPRPVALPDGTFIGVRARGKEAWYVPAGGASANHTRDAWRDDPAAAALSMPLGGPDLMPFDAGIVEAAEQGSYAYPHFDFIPDLPGGVSPSAPGRPVLDYITGNLFVPFAATAFVSVSPKVPQQVRTAYNASLSAGNPYRSFASAVKTAARSRSTVGTPGNGGIFNTFDSGADAAALAATRLTAPADVAMLYGVAFGRPSSEHGLVIADQNANCLRFVELTRCDASTGLGCPSATLAAACSLGQPSGHSDGGRGTMTLPQVSSIAVVPSADAMIRNAAEPAQAVAAPFRPHIFSLSASGNCVRVLALGGTVTDGEEATHALRVRPLYGTASSLNDPRAMPNLDAASALVAGNCAAASDFLDGSGHTARFARPLSIAAVHDSKSLFVADGGYIRRIDGVDLGLVRKTAAVASVTALAGFVTVHTVTSNGVMHAPFVSLHVPHNTIAPHAADGPLSAQLLACERDRSRIVNFNTAVVDKNAVKRCCSTASAAVSTRMPTGALVLPDNTLIVVAHDQYAGSNSVRGMMRVIPPWQDKPEALGPTATKETAMATVYAAAGITMFRTLTTSCTVSFSKSFGTVSASAGTLSSSAATPSTSKGTGTVTPSAPSATPSAPSSTPSAPSPTPSAPSRSATAPSASATQSAPTSSRTISAPTATVSKPTVSATRSGRTDSGSRITPSAATPTTTASGSRRTPSAATPTTTASNPTPSRGTVTVSATHPYAWAAAPLVLTHAWGNKTARVDPPPVSIVTTTATSSSAQPFVATITNQSATLARSNNGTQTPAASWIRVDHGSFPSPASLAAQVAGPIVLGVRVSGNAPCEGVVFDVAEASGNWSAVGGFEASPLRSALASGLRLVGLDTPLDSFGHPNVASQLLRLDVPRALPLPHSQVEALWASAHRAAPAPWLSVIISATFVAGSRRDASPLRGCLEPFVPTPQLSVAPFNASRFSSDVTVRVPDVSPLRFRLNFTVERAPRPDPLPIPASNQRPIEVAAEAQVAVSAAVSSSPTSALAMQRISVFSNVEGCGRGPPSGPLPFVDSPTQVKFPSMGPSLEYYAGAAAMNTLLIIGVVLLMVIVSAVYKVLKTRKMNADHLATGHPHAKPLPTMFVSFRRCRGFHVIYFTLCLMVQPTVTAGAMLAIFAGDARPALLGFGLTLAVALLVVFLGVGVLRSAFFASWVPASSDSAAEGTTASSPNGGARKPDDDRDVPPGPPAAAATSATRKKEKRSAAMAAATWLVAASGEWINTRQPIVGWAKASTLLGRWQRLVGKGIDDFVRFFEMLFVDFRGTRHWFGAFELFTSGALGVCSAASFRLPCAVGVPLTMGVALVYLLALLVARPHSVRLDLGFAVLFGILQATAAVFASITLWSSTDDENTNNDSSEERPIDRARDVIEVLVSIMAGLAFLRGFYDVSKFVWRLRCRPTTHAQKQRRSRLQRQLLLEDGGHEAPLLAVADAAAEGNDAGDARTHRRGDHMDAHFRLTEADAEHVMNLGAQRPTAVDAVATNRLDEALAFLDDMMDDYDGGGQRSQRQAAQEAQEEQLRNGGATGGFDFDFAFDESDPDDVFAAAGQRPPAAPIDTAEDAAERRQAIEEQLFGGNGADGARVLGSNRVDTTTAAIDLGAFSASRPNPARRAEKPRVAPDNREPDADVDMLFDLL